MTEQSRGLRRRAASRVEILEVARRHAVAHGWRDARVQAIAAEAGVSRPTLYKEFPSKRELGAALVRHENALFVTALQDALAGSRTAHEGLRIGVEFSLRYAEQNPLVARILQDEMSPDSLFPAMSMGADTVAPLAAETAVGLLRLAYPGADEAVVGFVGDAVVRLAFSHFLRPGGQTPTELAERIADMAIAVLGEQDTGLAG